MMIVSVNRSDGKVPPRLSAMNHSRSFVIICEQAVLNSLWLGLLHSAQLKPDVCQQRVLAMLAPATNWQVI